MLAVLMELYDLVLVGRFLDGGVSFGRDARDAL